MINNYVILHSGFLMYNFPHYVDGVGVARVIDSLDKENSFEFEHCSPFLTSTATFIQIGQKLAKLVILGGSGGYGVGWLGGLGGSNQKVTMDLSFAVHSLLPHQVSSKLDQNWQS